jgi:ribosomal protein S18 acetylase RimI-like enzyme
VWATDLDVLPLDRLVERRDGYWVIRSPSNPGHFWGNFLLFDAPPAPGDADPWEERFAAEFADSRHTSFGWDSLGGEMGAAPAEFGDRGYRIEATCGLIAEPAQITPHPRENREVEIRPLAPEPGADGELWEQVTELQVAGRDQGLESEAVYRAFSCARLSDLRALFVAGRGAWWVALAPDGELLGSCGIVVTGPRARYQTVDTAIAHRGRGICSRLLVEAAARTAASHPVRQFVIAADPDYHALGIYESLGFRRAELVRGALRTPPVTP